MKRTKLLIHLKSIINMSWRILCLVIPLVICSCKLSNSGDFNKNLVIETMRQVQIKESMLSKFGYDESISELFLLHEDRFEKRAKSIVDKYGLKLNFTDEEWRNISHDTNNRAQFCSLLSDQLLEHTKSLMVLKCHDLNIDEFGDTLVFSIKHINCDNSFRIKSEDLMFRYSGEDIIYPYVLESEMKKDTFELDYVFGEQRYKYRYCLSGQKGERYLKFVED